ncbi:hypothetical protein BIW11_09429, partial [Tropilaelaps mercedesae]
DITEAEMVRVLQTQFAPLAEALCKAVFDLSQRGDTATLDSLTLELMRTYPGMEKPASDIIYKTLGTLIRERRLYHTGNGYAVAEPEQFSRETPTLKKASLLTNGVDASKVLNSSSGESRQSTLERSASMRLLRERDRDKGPLCRSASVRLYNRSKSSLNDHADQSRDIHRQQAVQHTPQLAKRDSPKRSSMFSRFFRKKEKSSPEIVVVHTATTSTGGRDGVREGGRSDSHTAQTATAGTNEHHHQPYAHHQTAISTPSTTGGLSTSAPTGATSSSPKTRLSFAAQFPPVDWRDPDYINYHSKSTQTAVNREQQTTSSLTSAINNHQQHLQSQQLYQNPQQQQQPANVRHIMSGIRQADASVDRQNGYNVGTYHHHHPSQQQIVSTTQLHHNNNNKSTNNNQLPQIKHEIPSRALSLARHCHTARQSSCCSDATPEDSGAELSSRRRASSNSRSTRHRRHCSVSDEVCCRHRSSSPPRRKPQAPRRLPPTLPGDVSPLQLRKTHPRYLPAPPNVCKIPTLPPYPTSGLYRLNRPPLFPPAPPPNTDLFRQTERFRQHSSILFHSTDEDSPQLPRKAVISTEKEVKSIGTLGALNGLSEGGNAQVTQVITTSPKSGSIRHTTTVTNDTMGTSSLDYANNIRNSARSQQMPRYTGNAYLRSLNNNGNIVGSNASFGPMLCGTAKEKCTTTTRTTTTISEKIDNSGNCTTTTSKTGGVDENLSASTTSSSLQDHPPHSGCASNNGVNVCAPVGDYKSIVDVNVVTDAAGRTVTNIKTSVCANSKGRENPHAPSAKVEKTKPELITPADEKAISDTDLDAVDPPPEESSAEAACFFDNTTAAANTKTATSTGGNLSADDSGFLSTSPQPQSFVTTSS